MIFKLHDPHQPQNLIPIFPPPPPLSLSPFLQGKSFFAMIDKAHCKSFIIHTLLLTTANEQKNSYNIYSSVHGGPSCARPLISYSIHPVQVGQYMACPGVKGKLIRSH